VVAMVVAASSTTGLPVAEVLEDFGEFIVPDLVKMCGHLLRPEWGAIDVIENTEGTVHSVVRVKNPGAKPPELKTVRHGANEVVLFYLNYARTRPWSAVSQAFGPQWLLPLGELIAT